MIKRLTCLALALLLLSSAASAQNQIKPVVYVGGGLGLPLSPDGFKDNWKMGYGFGGAVGLQFDPSMEVIGQIFYNLFPVEEPAGMTIDGGEFQLINIGANFKYLLMTDQPEMKIHPYLTVGAGFASWKVKEATVGDTTFAASDNETDFSLNIGAGAEYMVSPKAAIWLDARYVYVGTEGDATSFLPIRAGVKFLFGN